MKVFKIVIYLTAAVALLLLGTFTYLGGFSKVTPTIKTTGGETLVYENVEGDYSQSAAVSDRVYDRLRKEFEVETTRGFGIFYDKPGTVETHKLRSRIGCILEDPDSAMIADIKTELFVMEFPMQEYLVAEFPIKGKMSFLVGVMKAYPAMEAFVKENGYEAITPAMEIWDIPNKKIIYRKELVRVTAVL